MNIGFWNIQRSTSEWNDRAEHRRDAMFAVVQEMSGPCDLIFLAEATQSAEDILADLQQVSGMRASFERVPDKNNNTSPCSFVTLAKPGHSVHKMKVGNKRPLIVVRANEPIWIGACHVIAAGGEKSAAEIATILDIVAELCKQDNCAGFVVGDMNLPIEDADEVGKDEWVPIWPRTSRTNRADISRTHRGGQILDYAWRTVSKAGFRSSRCSARPLTQSAYRRWSTIDHAPVGYQIIVT